MKSRQLSQSIELRVNCYGKVAIAPSPDFFVTEEKQQRNKKLKQEIEEAKKNARDKKQVES